jgi:hypothetical protein
MGDHGNRAREVGEDTAVPVTEHHLAPVPEGIGELVAVVDVSVQAHPVTVDRVPGEHLLEEIPRLAEHVECPVDGDVGRLRPVLGPRQNREGQRRGVPAVVDRPTSVAGSGDTGAAHAAVPMGARDDLLGTTAEPVVGTQEIG